MKRILSLIGGMFLCLGFVTTVSAAEPNWDLTGTWTFNDIWAGTPYVHTMVINSFNEDTGAFSGTGYYNANPSLTWDVNGVVSGNNVTVFHLLVKTVAPGVTLDGTGTINSTGTQISGTGYQSNLPGTNPNIEWTAVGTAKKLEELDKDKDKEDEGLNEDNDIQGEELESFAAKDSFYYNCPTVCADIYGSGPISFTWDEKTGKVISGYYKEQVPPNTGTIYYNPVVDGSVNGTSVTLKFDRSGYVFYFNGTLVNDVLTGTLAGPFYFTATGD